MSDLVRVDDEVITSDDFLKSLRLMGQFDELLENLVRNKLVVQAAKRSGITPTEEEIQERADQLRRIRGLHRSSDMHSYLTQLHVTIDDFERFVIDMLYHEKKEQEITSEAAVNEYFKLHSPQFDRIEIAHIVLDNEGAAREIIAIATEAPENFAELAKAHSVADTRDQGGLIGAVTRGAVGSDVEAKIFNSEVNEPIGPFPTPENQFEIFMVVAKRSAVLDQPTAKKVRHQLMKEWLEAEATQTVVEMA